MKNPSDLRTVFDKLKELTGAKIIIDSSKSFAHIQKCKKLFENNFHTIHIKRNPKGVVLSRKKIRRSRVKKNTHPKPGLASMHNMMLLYDSLEWGYENFWMERFKDKERNLDLTYDLMDIELEKKSKSFLGSVKEGLIFDPEKSKPDHMVWGNKGRFKFNNKIVVSHKWKNELNLFQKLSVDAITLPAKMLFNYKY